MIHAFIKISFQTGFLSLNYISHFNLKSPAFRNKFNKMCFHGWATYMLLISNHWIKLNKVQSLAKVYRAYILFHIWFFCIHKCILLDCYGALELYLVKGPQQIVSWESSGSPMVLESTICLSVCLSVDTVVMLWLLWFDNDWWCCRFSVILV